MHNYRKLLDKVKELKRLKKEREFLVNLIESNRPHIWLHNDDYEDYKRIKEEVN